MPSIYEVTDVKPSRMYRLKITQNIQRNRGFNEDNRDRPDSGHCFAMLVKE